jgi:hypothetical protein
MALRVTNLMDLIPSGGWVNEWQGAFTVRTIAGTPESWEVLSDGLIHLTDIGCFIEWPGNDKPGVFLSTGTFIVEQVKLQMSEMMPEDPSPFPEITDEGLLRRQAAYNTRPLDSALSERIGGKQWKAHLIVGTQDSLLGFNGADSGLLIHLVTETAPLTRMAGDSCLYIRNRFLPEVTDALEAAGVTVTCEPAVGTPETEAAWLESWWPVPARAELLRLLLSGLQAEEGK